MGAKKMREESGRSLIEIIGVLAIGVTMLAAAYSMYKTIDQRQKRLIAYETIQDIAKKTKILYAYSGYAGVSVSVLKTDGAIDKTDAPIGQEWQITTNNSNGTEFKIVLKKLDYGDCEYLKIKKADWAKSKLVNAKENGTCTKPNTANQNPNEVTFVVE